MATKRGGRRPSPASGRSTTPSRSRRSGQSGGTSGARGKTVVAFLLGAALAIGGAYLYLHPPKSLAPFTGKPSPSTPTSASPSKLATTSPRLPAHPAATPSDVPARTDLSAPFGTSEDVFEAGAHLYSARCASCHGTPRLDAAGKSPGTQLWQSGRHTLSTRAPGDIYTQIAGGNPAKGMPAYAHVLTDTQLWQLTLLLKNADGDLPDPVLAILETPPAKR